MNHRTLPTILLVFAAVAYCYNTIWSLYPALSSNDFKHIYLGMKALLDGNTPYSIQTMHHQAALQGYRSISLNPYVYLPFTAHAMAFLAPFTFVQAITVWFCLNHLFTLASIRLLSRLFPAPQRLLAGALLLLSFAFSTPYMRTLSAGQLNMALLLLFCLGFQALIDRREKLCGFLMAFATVYKLMPGLYALYFLLRRRWVAFISMAISGVALLTVSVLLAGPHRYLEFIPELRQMSYGKSTWPHVFSFWDDPHNQSLNSFFSHIFTVNDHTTPWIELGQNAANYATIAVTLLLTAAYIIVSRPAAPPETTTSTTQDQAAWCSTLLLALLIPSLFWDHYLVMIILPVTWMIHHAITSRQHALTATIAACYLITLIPWNFESTPWRTGPGILLMSLKLWPALTLYALSLHITRTASRATEVSGSHADAAAPATSNEVS